MCIIYLFSMIYVGLSGGVWWLQAQEGTFDSSMHVDETIKLSYSSTFFGMTWHGSTRKEKEDNYTNCKL